MNKSLIKTLPLCLGVLVLTFALSYLVSAWTEPTQTPPGGNVDTPLNVGAYGQYKLGNLVLNISGNTYPGLQVYGEHIPASGSPLSCPANYVLSGNECIKLVLYTSPRDVGIGTMTPQYTLDVNGDLNLQNSVLRLGGAPGATGDVIYNNNGVAGWSNLSTIVGSLGISGGIPQVPRVFSDPSGNPYTFKVPNGVTRIKIEMWGGGGGGSCNCYYNGGCFMWNAYMAGASGAYNTGIFDVIPGTNYTIAIGVGGLKNNQDTCCTCSAGGGQASSVSGPAITFPFVAGGGDGGGNCLSSGVCSNSNGNGGVPQGGNGTYGINGTNVSPSNNFFRGFGPGAPLGGGGHGIVPGSGGDYYQNGANGRVIIWY